MLVRLARVSTLLLGSFGISSGATLSFDLTCVLNGLNNHSCVSGPSFGTVTISDVGANQVSVFVDLGNSGLKFRDLMLNFTGVGFTDIVSNPVSQDFVLSPNGFSITPYDGDFDLGVNGGQGWADDSGYSVILQGVGGVLDASMFNALDSGGKVYVALHIQSLGPGTCTGADDGTTPCIPGTLGEGSLKIGGVPGSNVPEPSSVIFIGSGLLALGFLRRKRVSA